MGAWGRVMTHLTVGRIGRQLLAVGVLSLALLAAVLALGGFALSHLGLTPAPERAAAAGAGGVFTIATPSATPLATPQPRPHTPSVTATVAFRPVTVASPPRPRPSAPARTRKTAERKHRTKKRAVRQRRSSKPARTAPTTAAVASVTPAPSTPAPAVSNRGKRPALSYTHGEPKPKLSAPRTPAPTASRPHVSRGPKPKAGLPPGQAKKLKPVRVAPAPAAAPPAHANNGRGHGAGPAAGKVPPGKSR